MRLLGEMVQVARRLQRSPVGAEDAQPEAVPGGDGEDAVAAGTKHAHDLVHRRLGRVVVLERVPRHHGVEEVVGEGEPIAGRQMHVGAAGARVLHRLRVEVDAVGFPVAVAAQVAELVAAAAADVENARGAGRAGRTRRRAGGRNRSDTSRRESGSSTSSKGRRRAPSRRRAASAAACDGPSSDRGTRRGWSRRSVAARRSGASSCRTPPGGTRPARRSDGP